jgi:SAM-dependent methyltransferase
MIEIRHEGMNETASTQKEYDRIYSNQGIELRDSINLWILKLMKAKPGSTLLDISCGQGRLVELARRQGLVAMGSDFSQDAIIIAKSRYPSGIWLIDDGERLSIKDSSFDFITHIGSLEHYQNPTAGMNEIFRLLKPNGIACILLPNTFSLIGNILYVLKTGDVFDDGQPLQRYNTARGWEKLLNQNGLHVFRYVKFEQNWPRTWKDFGWYLSRPMKLFHLIASIFIPFHWANSLVYLCNPDKAPSEQ